MCIYYILIINSECIPIGCNWKFYKVGSGVWAFCEVLGSPPFNYHRFKSMDDVTSAESATAIIRTIFGGLLGLIDAKTARLLQGLKLNFRPGNQKVIQKYLSGNRLVASGPHLAIKLINPPPNAKPAYISCIWLPVGGWSNLRPGMVAKWQHQIRINQSMKVPNSRVHKPVGFRQLIGNVPEHLFHSFPRFTWCFVQTRHEVMTLFTEGFHLGICDLNPRLQIKLIPASAIPK